MKTVLSSATKTVVISPDDPFVIIGERINPTGRKKLAEEMRRFDMTRVREDAKLQVAALELLGELLAAGRVDALADDAERLVGADGHGRRATSQDGVHQAGTISRRCSISCLAFLTALLASAE